MRIENSIVIHQPHFLPWPPYLAKIALCEHFVVQDDVKYRKGYYHNRTKLIDHEGIPRWVTIPVHSNSHTLLKNTIIAHKNRNLLFRVRNQLISYSCVAKESDQEIGQIIEIFKDAIYSESAVTLSELNVKLIICLLKILDINIPQIHYSSNFNYRSCTNRTEKIMSCFKELDANKFITGWGKSTCNDIHDVNILNDENRVRSSFLTEFKRE